MPDLHVLIVDDDHDVREALAELLSMKGYSVRQASNGKVALAMMNECRPSLVLLDLMMPVMNGWEVLDRMQSDPVLRDIPVVVLSAGGAPPYDVPFVAKPPKPEHLLATVAHERELHGAGG